MTANYSTREYREKLYDDLHVRLRDTVILMCAIFIASIGLNMNSTAVIIGAMLISPLMTSIVGLGFGLAIFDTRLIKQSLEVLFTQVLVSLLVSTLYFWISPLSYASSELIARTSPTIWDVLIAIAGGIAGVIGSRKRVRKTNDTKSSSFLGFTAKFLCLFSFLFLVGIVMDGTKHIMGKG